MVSLAPEHLLERVEIAVRQVRSDVPGPETQPQKERRIDESCATTGYGQNGRALSVRHSRIAAVSEEVVRDRCGLKE